MSAVGELVEGTREREATSGGPGGEGMHPGRPSETGGSPTERRPSPESGRLQSLLRAVVAAGDGERVTIEAALDAVGQRSFGAMILLPALVLVSPLSGIPGVPTALGLVIFLVCIQYLAGRDRIWLPSRLRRAGMSRSRLGGALQRVDPFVRVLDRLVKPRMIFLVNPVSCAVFAAISAALALTLPPLEALPLTATTTAAVIALYGFAILARDGLIALIALAATGLALFGAVVFVLPGLMALVT